MIATQDEISAIKRALIEFRGLIHTNEIFATSEGMEIIKTAYNVLDNAIIVNPDNVTLAKYEMPQIKSTELP